jgi:hypothetical protein
LQFLRPSELSARSGASGSLIILVNCEEFTM